MKTNRKYTSSSLPVRIRMATQKMILHHSWLLLYSLKDIELCKRVSITNIHWQRNQIHELQSISIFAICTFSKGLVLFCSVDRFIQIRYIFGDI